MDLAGDTGNMGKHMAPGKPATNKNADVAGKRTSALDYAIDQSLILASWACWSAWYEERTNGPEATFLKPIL